MAKVELVRVLEKMVRDAPYRTLVKRDPDTALYRVDLTPAERGALEAWAPEQLVQVGIGAELAQAALREHPAHRRLEPSDRGVPSGPTGDL